MITIRSCKTEDYHALAQIYRAQVAVDQFYDYEAAEAELWHEQDASFDRARCTFRRFVAEVDGKVVGYAQFYNTPWAYDPRRYQGIVRVHPAYAGRGIGTKLYTYIEAAIAARGGTLRVEMDATHPAGVAFARRIGAEELFRSYVFRLNPRSFDPVPFADIPLRLKQIGVEIVSLADEIARNPAWLDQLYPLHNALKADLPLQETYTPMPREGFADYAAGMAATYFLAVQDGQYIGETYMAEKDGELVQHFTGVRRDWRGKGLARALNLAAIDHAAQHEYTRLTSWTESTNPAMVRLLDQLGFACYWNTIWYEIHIPQRCWVTI